MRISAQLAGRFWLIVMLIGGIAAFAYQRRSIEGLRGGHQELMEGSQEAQRLTQENLEIPRLLAENQEVEKLREANQDLLKLRNEVRQLRRQVEGIENLRAENQRLAVDYSILGKPTIATPPPPGDFLPRSALRDAGLGTPEAAVQTAFWAMSQGNIERLSHCVGVPNDAPWKRVWMQGLVQHIASFNGFSINEKKINSADEVELDLQSSVGGSIVPFTFRLVGNEWKLF